MARISGALHEISHSSEIVRLGQPSDGKFNYPIEKRRTKENVEALRRAEGHLDAFWAAIDQLMVAKAGNLRGTSVWNLLSQPRILKRTPEWFEPKKSPPTASTPNRICQADIYSSYQPTSAIYSGIPARELDITQPKTKTKTCGIPGPLPESITKVEEALLQQPNPTGPEPTISVDARALKVFRTVFFNPAVTSTPGEVSWSDFLHAMTSVGFTAMKLHGSAWQFQPTKLDVERSIQFHEPHPRGKLPFKMARRHGRRLNRAYGWHGGMFVLIGK